MAEKRPVFDYSTEGQNELHKHLECPICLDYLWDPRELPCGHLFCNCCIGLLSAYDCPTCRTPFLPNSLKRVSHVVFQMLDALLVKCQYAPRGCQWTGPRSNAAAHAASCELNGTAMSMVVRIAGNAPLSDVRERTFILPFVQATVVSVAIDWGDDSERTIVQIQHESHPKFCQHEYIMPGEYTVRVHRHGSGVNGCWLDHFGSGAHEESRGWADKLVSIDGLGKLGIRSLSHLFAYCSQIDCPLEHLDISRIADLSRMFLNASKFNQPIGE
eukprot:TRINITY_DN629_c0_g1_i1.p1 TRINITY_DN629_c0_g1~~TRINITY_DN629_c0_g1_i1.p1  ORF type:complete len:304 (-),score=12.62 TRINITY_DN629_c0_g1_i1:234-1049(-)